LREQGFPVSVAPAPVIVHYPSSPADAAAMRKRLLSRDILPTFIEYPAGPAQAYYRFAISSEHTPEQLANLLEAMTSD
jgi:7-keto-8-aminopelargonate synthetase-like enzyme